MEGTMAAEDNKALIRRFVAALNRREADALDPFFAPGYVHHSGRDQVLDLAGVKRGFAAVLAAVPDYRATPTHLLAEGELAAAYLVVRGTHRGAYAGYPPTGRAVTVVGTAFFRIEAGQIAEDWEVLDSLDLLRQLGASLAPPPAAV